MTRRRLAALFAPVLLALALVACGGDDDDAEASSSSSTAVAASADAFPVTIEHKYGSTTIDSAPERVVSVGYNDQDTILALGIVPVAIRDWYGDQPSATWPWAHELLDGAEPEVLDPSALNFEAIAALDPDLIIGVSSGMTEEEYDTLSAIAPTLTQSGSFVDYGMPWQDQTLMIGEALGKRDEAEAMLDDIEDRYEEVKADHPELAGAEATVSYVLDEANIGAYGPEDGRSRLLTDLGMVIPQDVVDAAGDQFYSSFSWEQIGMLDNDILIWIASEPGVIDQIKAAPLRQQLRAVSEGREIFLTDLEAGAASFSSVLSLPYLLDTLVPKLAAAVDGDPATAVAG
jgi:iron complex transport system substrate-binding protein